VSASLRARASSDPEWFLRTYLPHLAPEIGPNQRALWAALAACPTLAVVALRGWGKSSLVTIAESVRHLVTRDNPFVILSARTGDQSRAMLLQIRAELDDNDALRRDFGPWGRPILRQSTRTAYHTGVDLAARSIGSAARGLRSFSNNRPTLWILDDVQERRDAETGKRIARTMDFLNSTVLPSMAAVPGEPPPEVRVLGTKIADDCVMSRLERATAQGWACFRVDAEDTGAPGALSIWPKGTSDDPPPRSPETRDPPKHTPRPRNRPL
jgi:hypothetical protein